jgi:shikimate kinase
VLIGDSQFIEHRDCVLHRRPIRRTSHHDRNERLLRLGHRSIICRQMNGCKIIFAIANDSEGIGAMADRGNSLVLIGFMGTGKSAAGRLIARRLRLTRVDTDELVVQELGAPIATIFAEHGEKIFRDAETAVLNRLQLNDAAVIVTGGGVVLREENVRRLRELGTLIRLNADEDTIFRRISRRGTRPLLKTADPRATLRSLLATREVFYSAAADATVDTSTLTHEQTADEIIAAWNCAT